MALLRPSLEYGCKVWNTNECQDKASEFIQLHHKLKLYRKIKQMNYQRLPSKLIIHVNRWDSVKCRDRRRKSWLAQVDSLVKHLDLQDKELTVKIIREAIDKRECRQFETALQHKSKLPVYREL